MKFDRTLPAKVVMLGVGGTGGHIATHLYRLLHALERDMRFIICDGDIVERKNLVRQNFTPADLGMNKARVIAERYSGVFGMECEYIPEFIESDDELAALLTPKTWGQYNPSRKRMNTFVETVILIGAVDNNKSRQMCQRIFDASEDLIYIDSGNGRHTGQVVCGIRKNGKTVYAPLAQRYPDVLEEGDKFPTELSCAEASVSAPQSIMANVMAATAVLCIIYNVLAEGINTIQHLTFSSQLCSVRPGLEEIKTRPKRKKKVHVLELETKGETIIQGGAAA